MTAAQIEQCTAVRDRLHAFGDDLLAERIPEPDDPAHEVAVIIVVQHAAHETGVDLQHPYRQALQMYERRKPGAEIVERELDIERGAGPHDVGDVPDVIQCAGLGDFELDSAPRAWPGGEQAFEIGDKRGVMQ